MPLLLFTHPTPTPTPSRLPKPNYTPKTITSTDSNPKSSRNNSLDSKGSDVAAYQSTDATPAATFSACRIYATASKEEIMPVTVTIWTVSTAALMSRAEFAAMINIAPDVLFSVAGICPYAFSWTA